MNNHFVYILGNINRSERRFMSSQDGRKILIFDRDQKWANSASTILKDHGFESHIENSDFGKCHHEAAKGGFAAAIVNLHALDNPRRQLAKFKEDFPTIGLIATEDHPDADLEELQWPQHHIVDVRYGTKRRHLITDLGCFVEEFIKLQRMLPGDMEIDLPENIDKVLTGCAETWSGLSRIRGEKIPIDVIKLELKTVISQMFLGPTGHEPIAKKIKVEAFGEEDGFSGSSLFKLTPVVHETGKTKPAVLKFGPKSEILTESRNYDKFVEWFLTFDQTVRKISYGQASNFAGLLYSYPRHAEGGYMPYAEYIRHAKTEDCVAIISNMFDVSNQHWLSVDAQKYMRQDETRFETYYFKHAIHSTLEDMHGKHFRKLQSEITNLERKEGRVIWDVSDEKITFPILNLSTVNPMSHLTGAEIEPVKLTIVHGDLHGYNILIDKTGRYFMLDFFYTGYGDIYRDFLELELSIRYDLFCSRRLPDDKRLTALNNDSMNHQGLKTLLRLEKALIQKTVKNENPQDPLIRDNPDLQKAFTLITAIREYAAANCPEKMHLYYRGLVFSSLKALKYFYPVDVKVYRLLIAGLYADLLDSGQITDGCSTNN